MLPTKDTNFMRTTYSDANTSPLDLVARRAAELEIALANLPLKLMRNEICRLVEGYQFVIQQCDEQIKNGFE